MKRAAVPPAPNVMHLVASWTKNATNDCVLEWRPVDCPGEWRTVYQGQETNVTFYLTNVPAALFRVGAVFP